MKMAIVFVLLIDPDSFRKAWDIRRACRPIWESPISPSISARGTSAATESMTTMSTAPDETNASAISRPCSPVSGWESSNSSISTPKAAAYFGSKACSASINAATPPFFCTSAIAWRATVVLPDDSGPYTSMIRPLG